MSTDVYGYLAAGLTTIAFLPQVIKTYKRKSAQDISFLTLFLFLTGVGFWILYGFHIGSLPIMISNILTFILNIFILALKIFYSKK
tara:strand:+ start:9601 stop:9858 length:258 start_codon:yes stop_codon:yes gene_type:complete